MRWFVLFCFLVAAPARADDPAPIAEHAAPGWEVGRAIIAVVDAIDVAVDEKDWGGARAHFADEVRVDFTSLVGGAPATIPADALIAGWERGLHAGKLSHHMRSNHAIAIEGDRAQVVFNGYAWNKLIDPPRDDVWETWGAYEHGLVRTPDGWKVDAMTYRARHNRGDDAIRAHVAE